MTKVLNVYKPVGVTPLQLIDKLRIKLPEYKNEIIGYAGRLDPMVEGVLLLLVGDENKKRKEYEGLPKEYSFEILFGVSTDSFDTLGVIIKHKTVDAKDIENKLPGILKKYIGKHLQEYPPYSSMHVQGKPLFYWAREKRLQEISIPTKEIEIYDLHFSGLQTKNAQHIQDIVFQRINCVFGEFRQEEIKKSWVEYFNAQQEKQLLVGSFTIRCSSGTYIRSLVHKIGDDLKTQALAFSILRTRVGEYKLKEAIHLTA